jgi:hypothetical protein
MAGTFAFTWWASSPDSDVATVVLETDFPEPGISGIVQITLTSYGEYGDQGSVACGISQMSNLAGGIKGLVGGAPAAIANEVTQILTQVQVANAFADGVINIFM